MSETESTTKDIHDPEEAKQTALLREDRRKRELQVTFGNGTNEINTPEKRTILNPLTGEEDLLYALEKRLKTAEDEANAENPNSIEIALLTQAIATKRQFIASLQGIE